MKKISLYICMGLGLALGACGPKNKAAGEGHGDGHGKGHMGMHAEGQANGSGHAMQSEARIAVVLSAGERQHVLEEMRGLLQASQGMVEGLATGDMDLVQQSAKIAGTGGRNTTENQAMHTKMPKEWMQMGMSVHKSFDEMAQMAADGKPAKDIQLKLADAMNTCAACHTAYYLPTP